MRALFLTLLLAATSALAADKAPDLAPLKKWIARQDDFRSVAADFTQTRSLRVLRDPVARPGRLWFATPGSFRWELGTPAKTIVLRRGDSVLIITPEKKKAERRAASDAAEKTGGMAMMRFPIAKDFADFQRQFEILASTASERRCEVEVVPRDPQARKFMTVMKIAFDTVTGHMLAFEMVFKDGSSLRNEFTNVRVNQKIEREQFDYDLTGFEVKDVKD